MVEDPSPGRIIVGMHSTPLRKAEGRRKGTEIDTLREEKGKGVPGGERKSRGKSDEHRVRWMNTKVRWMNAKARWVITKVR
jgi:hypothetical protein